MTYEQIVNGLRSLSDEDFYRNPAIGINKLYQMTEALEKLTAPERAIPEMFAVMERLPKADFGNPGPLVFALESMDYTDALIASLRRRATWYAVDMVYRILNSTLPEERRRFFRSLLVDLVDDPDADRSARDHAAYILERQGEDA